MPRDGLAETQQSCLWQFARTYVVPLTAINSTGKITPAPARTVQKSICHLNLDIGLRPLLATAKGKGCIWQRGKGVGTKQGSAGAESRVVITQANLTEPLHTEWLPGSSSPPQHLWSSFFLNTAPSLCTGARLDAVLKWNTALLLLCLTPAAPALANSHRLFGQAAQMLFHAALAKFILMTSQWNFLFPHNSSHSSSGSIFLSRSKLRSSARVTFQSCAHSLCLSPQHCPRGAGCFPSRGAGCCSTHGGSGSRLSSCPPCFLAARPGMRGCFANVPGSLAVAGGRGCVIPRLCKSCPWPLTCPFLPFPSCVLSSGRCEPRGTVSDFLEALPSRHASLS